MALWQWNGGNLAVAIGCFCLLVVTIPKIASRPPVAALNHRLAVVCSALLLMVIVGHDLSKRLQTVPVAAKSASADRDPAGYATPAAMRLIARSLATADIRQKLT